MSDQNDSPQINWSKIRDVNDVILPVPFRQHTIANVQRLGSVPHGARVVDAVGNRFRVLGHGSVQGSVILRDRYRRQFHADINTRLRVLDAR